MSLLRHFIIIAVITMGSGVWVWAAEISPAPRYGTGVFFDQGTSLHPGDFSLITDGKVASLAKDSTPGGTSIAEATAAADRFGLGIFLEENIVGRMAGAQVASRYTVTGAAEGTVVQGLMFSISGKAIAKGTGNFGVTLMVLDYRGNFLAEVAFSGERIIDEDTRKVFEKDSFAGTYCPDPIKFPGSCNDPKDPAKPKTVWFSGEGTSATVPLFLPVLKNNGIIVELWGNTDNEVRVDFLGAANLTGSPPIGVVVTLSTGQTFGSPR